MTLLCVNDSLIAYVFIQLPLSSAVVRKHKERAFGSTNENKKWKWPKISKKQEEKQKRNGICGLTK